MRIDDNGVDSTVNLICRGSLLFTVAGRVQRAIKATVCEFSVRVSRLVWRAMAEVDFDHGPALVGGELIRFESAKLVITDERVAI